MPQLSPNITGFTVVQNGTIQCLARVVGWANTPVVQADISSGTYTASLIDDDDETAEATVTGHDAQSITIASVIFNTLQLDYGWSVDGTGYNFRHVVPINVSQLFTLRGRRYRVKYSLVPASGQVIVFDYVGTVK